jgi:hypothetical protein
VAGLSGDIEVVMEGIAGFPDVPCTGLSAAV